MPPFDALSQIHTITER